MRHRKKINHLGRTSSHRKAMLANMASSLIMHKKISTTTAKAKALRIYVEPLLTKAKDDSTHSRRIVFSFLKNKEAVSELFREISQKIAERPGGYTRILKTGNRLGDNADMCIIELVDYNENMLAAKGEAKLPAKRSRRSKKKADSSTEIAEAKTKTEPKLNKVSKSRKAAAASVEVLEEIEAGEISEQTETPAKEDEKLANVKKPVSKKSENIDEKKGENE